MTDYDNHHPEMMIGRTGATSRHQPAYSALVVRAPRAGRRVAATVSRVIGLTGGIGSGKSAVARLLGERGAAVITPIRPLTRCTAQGPTAGARSLPPSAGRFSTATEHFPPEACRHRVQRRIGPRQTERHRASAGAATAERSGCRARRQGARVVVVEVPLLVEAIRSAPSWTRMFDEVWVVTGPEAQVIDRVREPRAEDVDCPFARPRRNAVARYRSGLARVPCRLRARAAPRARYPLDFD